MSRFHIGQLVWIGYCPDSEQVSRGSDCRLCDGVLLSGPFSSSIPSRHGEQMNGTWWRVEVGDVIWEVCERVIFPRFSPPAREVDIEQCLSLTE